MPLAAYVHTHAPGPGPTDQYPGRSLLERPAPPHRCAAGSRLTVGDRSVEIFRLDWLQASFDVARLPFSLKIMLENLLRTEGNGSVTAGDIEALATWDPKADPSKEIAFTPARVVMQDFTGVPAVVDLAAMRDAMADMGGDPGMINPLGPAELVLDQAVQVDTAGQRAALAPNEHGFGKMIGNGQEAKGRGGSVIAITTEGDSRMSGVLDPNTDFILPMPATTAMLTPIVMTIPLQLLAYHIAVRRGCDVDQPRNLAKSVTVE